MASRVWATAGGTLTSRGPWPRVPPGGPPGAHGSAPPAASPPALLWGRRRASSPSLSPSIVSRFFSLVGTRLLPSSGTLRFLGGQVLGPCAPSTCIRHVGHIPCTLGFGPSGRSTQAASQAGGGPLRGARRDTHVGAFCVTIAAFCIEIAALCIEIAALCSEIVMLLPSASQLQRCASKWRHWASKLLHYALHAPPRQPATRASGRQALEPGVRWSLG